jgi:acyl-coenzyme A thioesterase PaaI-like protein
VSSNVRREGGDDLHSGISMAVHDDHACLICGRQLEASEDIHFDQAGGEGPVVFRAETLTLTRSYGVVGFPKFSMETRKRPLVISSLQTLIHVGRGK